MGNLQQTMAHFILFINRNSLLMKEILTIILFTSCFITYGQSNMGEKILSDKQENIVFSELNDIITSYYQKKESIYSKKMSDSDYKRLKDMQVNFKNEFKNKTESLAAEHNLKKKEILSIYYKLKSNHSSHDCQNHQ